MQRVHDAHGVRGGRGIHGIHDDLGNGKAQPVSREYGHLPVLLQKEYRRLKDKNHYYLVNGRVLTPYRQIAPGGVEIKDGYIARVFPMDGVELHDGDGVLDVRGAIIAPGLIDLHLHGGGGADVMDGTAEAFASIARVHAQSGTTAIVPTTLTSSLQDLSAVLAAFSRVKKEITTGARLLGLHLEGPYFSPARRGAQDGRYIRNPDPGEYRELLDKYPEIIRVSAAPELPGGLELGRELRRRKILAAIGHSDATAEEVVQAIEAGYSHVTHLYLGMSGVKKINGYRCAGVIEAGLLYDDLTVELIADGKHLPPPLLKLVYKCKGPGRIALCSDALRPAAMPEGEYYLGAEGRGQKIRVKEGVAWLGDNLAGSVVTGSRLVRNMVELAGVPLKEALQMMTATPARILRLDHFLGSLDPGKAADLVVLAGDLSALATIVGGRLLD